MEHRSQYFDPATQWLNAHNARHGQIVSDSTLPTHIYHSDDLFPMDDFDRALLADPVEPCRQIRQDANPNQISPQMSSSMEPSLASGRAEHSDLYNRSQLDRPSVFLSFPDSSPTIAIQNRRKLQRRMPPPSMYELPYNPEVTTSASSQDMLTAEPPAGLDPLRHATPRVQGISLVETFRIPDKFRCLFKFPLFNAVQSKCFAHAYEGDDNIVLSAPTGSGKTAVMELTICRLLLKERNDNLKVVYQAPTKSLCSERYRDWSVKFRPLGLQCAELTGDVESANLRHVQQANVIIATPEKWDSVTRRWKDNAKLMRMIRLFLVDEVHILKESRGATLEAVVSRMKSVGTDVRFVALSATVPNSEDIATWLGLNSSSQHLPAIREVFGESFRPTELSKHVIGYQSPPNEFILDNMLVKEVPSVIARYSKRKPVMIFCPTQKSAAKMAKSLADLWLASSDTARLWPAPRADIKVMNPELQKTIGTAVAFHHGGLDATDRQAVEAGFLNGNISIICSTSTLAVGVNLPCYLVILKGTSCYTDTGLQEYSILETMQMLGRAGRPQFETSACAVIMTSKDKVLRYEKLIAGEDVLESSLHENLIEHLNAEIGIGTISNITSARSWLKSTFLHVRISRNPTHYKLEISSPDRTDNAILDMLCQKNLEILEAEKLIETTQGFRCTEFGQAMSRFYVKFDTMKYMLALPPKARQSEMLCALTQAVEFKELRWKSGEKGFYKKLNKSTEIRYPIKVDIALPAHKTSLIIQAALGGYMLDKSDMSKFNLQLQQDTRMVLTHANRLIRCMIDVQLSMDDATAAKHALELGRSLAAKVWDDTPMQLKQLEGIGDVTARKFASHGIMSIEALSSTDAHKIELVLGKNPPYGTSLLSRLQRFPNLLVTVKQVGRKRTADGKVEIRLKCEIGSLNEKINPYFNKKPVYVCFLCETACGKLIDFRRFSASRLTQAGDFAVTAHLERETPKLLCHVMCDEIAGTHRQAEVKPDIPASWFTSNHETRPNPSTGCVFPRSPKLDILNEDFDDLGFVDDDFLAAETTSPKQNEAVYDVDDLIPSSGHHIRSSLLPKRKAAQAEINDEPDHWQEPTRLPNGNWICQHTCTEDNKLCKHLCCKEGVKRLRKRPKLETSAITATPVCSKAKSNSYKPGAKIIDEMLAVMPRDERKDSRNEVPNNAGTLLVSHEKTNVAAKGGSQVDCFDISSDSLPDIECLLYGANTRAAVTASDSAAKENDLASNEEEYFELFDLDDCDWNISTVKINRNSPQAESNSSSEVGIHISKPENTPQRKRFGSSAAGVSRATTESNFENPIRMHTDQREVRSGAQSSPDPDQEVSTLEAFVHNRSNEIKVRECSKNDTNLPPLTPRYRNVLSSRDKTGGGRKKSDYDEDQRSDEAQFDPWMYE